MGYTLDIRDVADTAPFYAWRHKDAPVHFMGSGPTVDEIPEGADPDEYSETWSPLADALRVLMTMLIGVGEITEENWEAVFVRIHAMELACGALRQVADGDGGVAGSFTTAAEVRAAIGMKVTGRHALTYNDYEFSRRLAQALWDQATAHAAEQLEHEVLRTDLLRNPFSFGEAAMEDSCNALGGMWVDAHTKEECDAAERLAELCRRFLGVYAHTKPVPDTGEFGAVAEDGG